MVAQPCDDASGDLEHVEFAYEAANDDSPGDDPPQSTARQVRQRGHASYPRFREVPPKRPLTPAAKHFDLEDCIRRAKSLLVLERAVLHNLVQHRNNRTGVAWPAVETIAMEVGASERAVRYTLKSLEAKGWLRRDIRAADRRTSEYTVTPNLADMRAKKRVVTVM